jgi:hypothetical protein
MKIVSVGCSFTEGSGVKRENCYTSELAKLLNCNLQNHGEAGHSNQYIFRKTIQLLKNWNYNDILIVQWTNPLRDEIITKEGYIFQPPAHHWVSLEFLYGKDPSRALEKMGIMNKDDFDKKIVNDKQQSVLDYSVDFFNKDYQLNISFCFQYSLFGLLEKLGIKYIMFFGWKFYDYENQTQIFPFVNQKFLKENFGSFTNTPGEEHPDADGHLKWANYLYEKIIEFNYNKKEIKLI